MTYSQFFVLFLTIVFYSAYYYYSLFWSAKILNKSEKMQNTQ